MSKIVAMKFLKVTWNKGVGVEQLRAPADARYDDPRNESNQAFAERVLSKGLEDALEEMENMLSDYLKEGWQPKGELSYVTTDHCVTFTITTSPYSETRVDKRTHLVQTLVKYETPTDLNLFDCGPFAQAQTRPKSVTDDLLELNM